MGILTWSTKNVRLGDLKPYEHNPRFMSAEQFERLKKSITNKGYGNLIEVNTDMTILAGHQRVKALYELGWKDDDLIEIRMPDYEMTEKDFKEYLLESNFIDGEFDREILLAEFDLNDLRDIGFGDDIIDVGNANIDKDDDIVQDVDENRDPKTKQGDIYELGEHFLFCGDSTTDRIKSLVGSIHDIDLILTDPPYELDIAKIKSAVDCCNDIVMLCTFKQAIGLTEFFHFHFDFVFVANLPKSFMNKKQPYYLHQTGIYLTKNGETSFHCDNAKGIRSENGYWSTVIDAPRDISVHGHGKSVSGIIDVLSGWSARTIYDPFLGSGSTMIAAEKMGRKCIGVELSPLFCDVIVARYRNFCKDKNKECEIKLNGKPFNPENI